MCVPAIAFYKNRTHSTEAPGSLIQFVTTKGQFLIKDSPSEGVHMVMYEMRLAAL